MPGREAGAPPTSRYKARSSGPLRFHTDRTDVVALLCVRQARAGGVSRVVSSVAIHDAILARRPDLHALLLQDYHRSREGEEAGGERRTYALPVWGIRDGRFTSQYSRTFVEAAQRLPGVPPLTAAAGRGPRPPRRARPRSSATRCRCARGISSSSTAT